MRGGRAYKGASEVLFESDCDKLEEAAREERANMWDASGSIRQKD